MLHEWIDSIDSVAGCSLLPVSVDASFRRYFRVQNGAESFIAMDAPPPEENCRPFVEIAAYLGSFGLSVPEVIESDIENGFLLLTDLGDLQYLDALRSDPHAVMPLYDDAIEALLVIQRKGKAQQDRLPPYDEERLRFELSLFRDWLCNTHLSLEFSADDEKEWMQCCDVLVESALQQPRVFTHRDFHSRNLMVLDEGNPGILDFQDALEGPFTYDLASLLRDCYISLPPETVRELALCFYGSQSDELLAEIGEAQFFRFFDLMGVQRQLKAAGIFCRLKHRDGKPGYLHDVPRTLQHILGLGSHYPELGWIQGLISEKILPAWGDEA